MRRAWPVGLFLLVIASLLIWRSRDRADADPAPQKKPAAKEKRPAAPSTARVVKPDTLAPPPEPKTENAYPSGLAMLMSLQNADGSWGTGTAEVAGFVYDRAGTTALALLTFLGAGYTHLSKDATDDGRRFGDAVRKALQFLADSRPEGALNNSLVSLAITEAYGLTGSKKFQDQSRIALDRFLSLQDDDGSWGSAFETTLAAESLKSAELAGLKLDKSIRKRTEDHLRDLVRTQDVPYAAAGLALLGGSRDEGVQSAKKRLMSVPPDWSQQDYAYWYLGSMAMFHSDGPTGESWKVWSRNLKSTLLPNQNKATGSWAGDGNSTPTIVQNSLATLTLQVYYRYSTHIHSESEK